MVDHALALGGVQRTPAVLRFLLGCTLAELILLGSGRLLEFGPLTVRMALFGAGLGLAGAYIVHRRKVGREIGVVMLAFCLVTLLGAIIGLLSGASVSQVVEDVKPLAFFLSIAFFSLAIRTVRDVARVATIVRVCSLVLAVGYLLLLAALFAGLLQFGPLYMRLNNTGEFFFRGQSGFFYKGFVYLGIGIFFFAFQPGLFSKLAAALLFAALAATLTRGMLLATAVVLALALVIRQRNLLFAVVATVGIGVASVVIWSLIAAAFEDRGASDAVRLNDIQNVIDGTTWWSILIGHGLGTSIGVRDRIEATYLEFLYKQGLVGLSFWGAVFGVTVCDFWRARRIGRHELAEPFFLGSTFVFLESATNPFLTNPIGMSLVVVALVALRVLARSSAASGGAAAEAHAPLPITAGSPLVR